MTKNIYGHPQMKEKILIISNSMKIMRNLTKEGIELAQQAIWL